MADKKMSFTLPQDLAAESIAAKLREREEQLGRVCKAANHSADAGANEASWDALRDATDAVQEPW